MSDINKVDNCGGCAPLGGLGCNNEWIWIILIVVFFFCFCGDGFFGNNKKCC